jgi:nucleotide-binding universal stress UspA family protein
MFERIVVGVDGRQGGEDALVLARLLARGSGRLVLVHAYPAELLASRAAELDYERVVRDDARRLLAEAEPPELPCTTVVVGDVFPGRALHTVAEEHGADLLVVGSCHRGPAGRILAGDVTRATLHGAPCPVAVAPRDFRQRAHRIRAIGVGSDDSPEARAAVALATALADGLGAALQVLRVPHGRHAGHELSELSRHVDLLVAGSRRWGRAHRVLLGSTGERLTRHAACPVVLVPRPAPIHPAPGGRHAVAGA